MFFKIFPIKKARANTKICDQVRARAAYANTCISAASELGFSNTWLYIDTLNEQEEEEFIKMFTNEGYEVSTIGMGKFHKCHIKW